MNSYRQTLFNHLTTPAAPLAGVGRVHHHQLATSLFHFVCQHLREHAQTCIVRGQREMSVRVDELGLRSSIAISACVSASSRVSLCQ